MAEGQLIHVVDGQGMFCKVGAVAIVGFYIERILRSAKSGSQLEDLGPLILCLKKQAARKAAFHFQLTLVRVRAVFRVPLSLGHRGAIELYFPRGVLTGATIAKEEERPIAEDRAAHVQDKLMALTA